MSKNIFEIWKDNGETLPFAVRRDNWSNELYTVVEKIEIKKWPYGNAYGYPTVNGKYSNHYNYHKPWREKKIIPCAGCYQWTLVPAAKISKKDSSNSEEKLKAKKRVSSSDTNTVNINQSSKQKKSVQMSTVLNFGKYKGKTVENIFKEDPSYIFWCIRNITDFYISKDDLEAVAKVNKFFEIPQDVFAIIKIKEGIS